jgi:UDP-N-acetylmuramoyl-L-alanyl-D-glutamate--2,6-diaminopimelate ligase
MTEKQLEHIIYKIPCRIIGRRNISIRKISFDSRQIGPADMFVAVKGTHLDGHKFIDDVIRKGANSILCERLPDILPEHVTFIQVEDSAFALGLAVSNYYDNPSSRLKLVGVTGTNGKTSIATLLYKLLTQLGHKSGLISTVRNMIGDREIAATHTTPDAIAIQSMLRQMVDKGCTYAFMEVSSHSIDQKRISGLEFDIAIFTNLTHDHLDYHKTFEAYLKAKKQLFDSLPPSAFALVNSDDRNGKVMVQNTRAKVKTFGVRSIADFKAKIIESHFDGMLVTLDNVQIWIKLIGEFNVSNVLAVYAAASLLGHPKDEILRIISTLGTVDGRFEYVRSDKGITAIIDYAHTPDALKNVLTTINQIRSDTSQLITVVGAGGDRDRTKRPVMGRISAEMSNRVILTSDNPRSEDPDAIIAEMMEGVENENRDRVLAITDRKEAIKTACMMARSGDVILIAGKGHETYQEIKGVKNYFNDKQLVSEIFKANQINLQ